MSDHDHDDDAVDKYGNPLDGSEIVNCCYPDCGCDGARLCMAKNGASGVACAMNIERGSLPNAQFLGMSDDPEPMARYFIPGGL